MHGWQLKRFKKKKKRNNNGKVAIDKVNDESHGCHKPHVKGRDSFI